MAYNAILLLSRMHI